MTAMLNVTAEMLYRDNQTSIAVSINSEANEQRICPEAGASPRLIGCCWSQLVSNHAEYVCPLIELTGVAMLVLRLQKDCHFHGSIEDCFPVKCQTCLERVIISSENITVHTFINLISPKLEHIEAIGLYAWQFHRFYISIERFKSKYLCKTKYFLCFFCSRLRDYQFSLYNVFK